MVVRVAEVVVVTVVAWEADGNLMSSMKIHLEEGDFHIIYHQTKTTRFLPAFFAL